MNKTYIGIGILIILIGIGAAWYVNGAKSAAPQGEAATDWGVYSYECDEHVGFTMKPSSDMSSIAIAPTSGAYPPAMTLMKKDATSGVRYEGDGVVFTAKGETVTLGEGDSAITCSPVQNPDEAPFNFGD